jgi:signal transduction histidine kinase
MSALKNPSPYTNSQTSSHTSSQIRSSVLVIGHPNSNSISFGADFASDFESAREPLDNGRYAVIVLPCSAQTADRALELLQYVSASSPLSQRVIIENDTPPDLLRRIINAGSVFRILPSFDDANFDLTVQQALEEYNQLRQNAKLLQLMNEQNERLRKLTIELEERVEARRKSLEDAKEKLLVTNHRSEALHRALVAIHKAASLGEMERLVTEALSSALGLSWTRVLYQDQGFQAQIDHQAASGSALSNARHSLNSLYSVHRAALTRGRETLGAIHFARSIEKPFTRDETSFLGQVADAVSLATDRLTKLEQSEALKHQWEATFDAILEPVSLIKEDYTVIRINRAFAHHSGTEPENVIGRKCHEALFGRSSPCEGCTIGGANFRLKSSRTTSGAQPTYEVFSQRIEQQVQFIPEDPALFVNMYHDVSEQLRYERQILESAKMAELGTIGSSIAHELNNPLGGMLSFLQLIKMDISDKRKTTDHVDQPYYDDIDEMETGARRCRDIVQSLLGFTRKSGTDLTETTDLREAIEQALKITELQTRAMGISVRLDLPAQPAMIRAQFNSVAQALRNFLQNAQESIAETKVQQRAHALEAQQRANAPESDRRVHGEIVIRLTSDPAWHKIEIQDNGAGLAPQIESTSLGLNLAQQIISQLGGKLEIHSTKDVGSTAMLWFPAS